MSYQSPIGLNLKLQFFLEFKIDFKNKLNGTLYFTSPAEVLEIESLYLQVIILKEFDIVDIFKDL